MLEVHVYKYDKYIYVIKILEVSMYVYVKLYSKKK